MPYVDQHTGKSKADPELLEEAEGRVLEWARPQNRNLQPATSENGAARQKASRVAIQVQKAVERYAKEGLGPEDFERLAREAERRADIPLDQDLLLRKIGLATSQMVDLIITGQVNPRSAAEAANVAETLTRIAGTLRIDAAALNAAAQVGAQVTGQAIAARFKEQMRDYLPNGD